MYARKKICVVDSSSKTCRFSPSYMGRYSTTTMDLRGIESAYMAKDVIFLSLVSDVEQMSDCEKEK